jgi:hypothetical protein
MRHLWYSNTGSATGGRAALRQKRRGGRLGLADANAEQLEGAQIVDEELSEFWRLKKLYRDRSGGSQEMPQRDVEFPALFDHRGTIPKLGL